MDSTHCACEVSASFYVPEAHPFLRLRNPRRFDVHGASLVFRTEGLPPSVRRILPRFPFACSPWVRLVLYMRCPHRFASMELTFFWWHGTNLVFRAQSSPSFACEKHDPFLVSKARLVLCAMVGLILRRARVTPMFFTVQPNFVSTTLVESLCHYIAWLLC